MLNRLKEQNTQLQKALQEEKEKNQQLEREVEVLKQRGMRDMMLSNIEASNEKCLQYTGVPDLQKLHGLISLCEKHFPSVVYGKGAKSTPTTTPQSQQKKGPARLLTRKEEIILTLFRLRTGVTVRMCSDLFAVSPTTVSTTFNTLIPILTQLTSPLRQWPSKEQVRQHLPPSLKKDYPKTRVIIDCTEFFIQKPMNPTTQSQTYSQYKSHNTYKCLVGVSPTGAFTFVSDLYGGNASDKFIVEHSGFLNNVEYGDDIMADRGFVIRSLLADRGATLNMPPFTRRCAKGKGKRLNDSEIKQTRKIAKHRIHVERGIQRLKQFKILQNEIPSSLKDVINDCVLLAASLCNLLKPLAK
jgi:hypothetical protein